MVGDSLHFFRDLPGVLTFEEACNTQNFVEVPESWFVVITDVEKSTDAISSGKYKDVNMVGAATVAAAVNTCDPVKVPFVFGGDGATVLIPKEYVRDVEKEMLALQQFSQDYFGLDVRAGIIPVSDIVERGHRLLVSKLIMSTGATMAFFAGSGAQIVDYLVKSGHYLVKQNSLENLTPNLAGLSCRWKPVPASKGVVLTLIVQCLDAHQANEVYQGINSYIASAINEVYNPMRNRSGLKYIWPSSKSLRAESLVVQGKNRVQKTLKHVFEVLLFHVFYLLGLPLGSIDIKQYREDMIKNSDYRKFDGTLRMVIDCTEEQADEIEGYLEGLWQKRTCVYGVHRSSSALLTCFVQTLQSDGHIHFVDGNDGGYTVAATSFKARLAEVEGSS